jgi:DEAD/DEAH box helicase domain-containing protein
MRKIVFDIETANVLPSMSRQDIEKLDIAIVCIHDSETDTYSSYTVPELPQLWPIIERADMLIGFNSNSFDIPLLNKYYPGDLTRIRSLDLLVEVHEALGRRIRLNTLAEATLGRGKSGHGLEAVEWWQKGEVEKVRAYCEDDVRITKELYDYAREHGHVKYKDLNQIKDIKLSTKHWEKPAEAASMTFTLPL